MTEKYKKYNDINELPLHYKPAHVIRTMLDSRQISPEEIKTETLKRIAKIDNKINSFLRLCDINNDSGEKNAFWLNIPIALKDNIATKNIITTAGSRILENHIPIFDATVTKKLKDQNAFIVGKTNLDEFAMGSSTENSAFKKTVNPWDYSCVPGGSSGGSAAAVASGMAYMALGSDTGGSIRQPAALCGVCGMKPTYGRVSRYGLIAFASSLDQIGPFTRDAVDMAHALDAISGHDSKDSTSSDSAVDNYSAAALKGYDFKNLKIGIPEQYFTGGIDAGVLNRVEAAIEEFKKLGATVVKVSLPNSKYAIPVYYLIATAEASSNLARFDGVKYGFRAPEYKNLKEMYMKTREAGFGAEVKRRIILGTYALSSGYYDAYYKKAQKARTLICQDFENAFKKVDVILTPVTPSTAFKFNEKTSDPLAMYMSDIFTISINLASIPAMSIPCGLSENMPVGLQILGNYFQEAKMLAIAAEFQKHTDHHLCMPAI